MPSRRQPERQSKGLIWLFSLAFGCEPRSILREILTLRISARDPKPPFIRQSSCKRRPDNSCPCNGVEPTPTDIPRPRPARANACVGLQAQFPRKELSCRLGHDVAAADIDAGGREGAVRLLGGGGGRDGGAGF